MLYKACFEVIERSCVLILSFNDSIAMPAVNKSSVMWLAIRTESMLSPISLSDLYILQMENL